MCTACSDVNGVWALNGVNILHENDKKGSSTATNGALVVDAGCVKIVFSLVTVVDGIIGRVDITSQLLLQRSVEQQ